VEELHPRGEVVICRQYRGTGWKNQAVSGDWGGSAPVIGVGPIGRGAGARPSGRAGRRSKQQQYGQNGGRASALGHATSFLFRGNELRCVDDTTLDCGYKWRTWAHSLFALSSFLQRLSGRLCPCEVLETALPRSLT